MRRVCTHAVAHRHRRRGRAGERSAAASRVAAAGAVGPTFNRWRPNANVTTGLVGYEGVFGNSAGNNTQNRTTFDPKMLNSSLISPVTNNNFFGQGSIDLDILGDAQVYYEVLMNRRESSQVVYRQLVVDYMYGSPLLPDTLRTKLFDYPNAISWRHHLHTECLGG